NCSTECRCNRHSECAGVGARDHCLLCRNHTKGSHCEQCLPLFVGSAVGGGTCRPCHAFCRGNSHICISRKELQMSKGEPKKYSLDPEEIENWVTEGPSEDEAVCVNCQNNSYGEKCESCLQGYFLLDGKCTNAPSAGNHFTGVRWAASSATASSRWSRSAAWTPRPRPTASMSPNAGR
ncbi:multiple EGF like domains 8, partial [Homo sapiens]